MRIAFTGASGTGKSTLAQWLSRELSLPMNPVGARSVAKDMGFVDFASGEPRPYLVDRADAAIYRALGGVDSEDPDVRLQAAKSALGGWAPESVSSCRHLFQDLLQKQKMAWESSHPSGFITDRTVCDNLAYEILHSLSTITMEKFDRTYEAAQGYDFIFLCPVDSFYSPDGDRARVQDRAYHEAYECLLEGMVERSLISADYSSKVWYLSMPDLRDRQDFIRSVISLPRDTQEQ